MVFDEPTAHLDAATADALAAEILATTASRRAVIVTHRPEQTPGLPQLRLDRPSRTLLGDEVAAGGFDVVRTCS
jgi:ATP-binding cassette subfamily C protein CydCD